MGEPNKGRADPEKGLLDHQDIVAHPSHCDRVPHVDDCAGKEPTYKTNPDKAKDEKKFRHEQCKHILPPEEHKDTNIVGNITKLLPANTFLMFQTLAPLATNDGHCQRPEIIMTSIMLIILASTCMIVCFTDTMEDNGKVYHGLVTRHGLWNPLFESDPSLLYLRKRYTLDKGDELRAAQQGFPSSPRTGKPELNRPYIVGSTYSSGNGQYHIKSTDYLHAVLSTMAFATLTMLTNPVSTCFYPDIPSTVVKTLPLLVGFVISAIFAFSPPARNGIAHPLSPKPPKKGDKKNPDDNNDDNDSRTGSEKRITGKLSSSSDRDDHPPNPRSAAQSAYPQGAKDPMLQIHRDISELSRQSSITLTRGNSMLQSAGNSLSLPAVHEGSSFHQDAQALQNSGLVSQGADAAHIALGTGQALHPGSTLSPQAKALSAFNRKAAGALVKDAGALVQQGGKSLTEVQDKLALQQSAFSQGLNAQLQTLRYSPATSVAHNLTALGSQTENQIQEQRAAISQGTFAATLASAAAREIGSLLQVGADQGMAGVRDELARKQASITQPVSLVAQGVASVAQQGAQAASEVHADVMKQKAALVEEVNAQMQALSTPATSVAQDLAALRTGAPGSLTQQGRDEASQKLIDGVNSQFAATLAQSMARGMSMRMHGMPPVQEHISQQLQPAASVAIDVASLLQQGSQMHTQLAAQQAATLTQGLINQTQAAAQQVVETHLRRLPSLPVQPPELTATLLTAAQPAASVAIDTIVDSRPVQQMRDNAGLVIEDVTDAAAAGQALAAASARLWRDQRAESTEITDSISIEEITSESETEGRSLDRFRAGDPGSSSNGVKKL